MVTPRIDKKFYKKYPPEETIQRIRQLLFNIGLFITEESNYEKGFYHSHVCIANEGLLEFNLMTNGKGRSPAYALASAYSEMMERLQNGYKFYGERFATSEFMASLDSDSEFVKRMRKANAVLDYISYEDEKLITLKEYLLSSDCVFPDNQKKYILEHGDKQLLDKFSISCVPYYEIFNGKVRYLPSDCYGSGSNGMCAGNAPAEALVQGFCEIFERYALKRVMLNDTIPPQIPLSYFEGTEIFDKISRLENTKVIVLDCSISMQLPVIGVIVINTDEDSCCLEMAGAPTASVALERCMTEHFQDGDPTANMSKVFFKENNNSLDEKYHQFYNQSKGFGRINLKLLLMEQPDYEFEGFHTVLGDSSEEELVYIVNNILKPNNLNCYIRDNSILGYPAYHIYIPGFSDIYDIYNDEDLYATLNTMSLQSYVLNLKKQSHIVLQKICDNSLKAKATIRSSQTPLYANFLYNTYTRENKPDNGLFLATILLQIGDFSNAEKLLEEFVEKINTTMDKAAIRYYNCALDYLKAVGSKLDVETIKERLSHFYQRSLVDEVVSDITSSDKLQYYKLPSCFDCEICPVKSTCRYPDAMTIVKRIQSNTILKDQNGIITMMNQIIGESRKSNKE